MTIPTSRMGKGFSLVRRLSFQVLHGFYLFRTAYTPNGSVRVCVSPGCQLSVLKGRLPVDPVHSRFIEKWINSKSIVWDIGGNMGLFCFPAALIAKQVFTFEPDLDLAKALIASTSRNPKLNVTVAPLAVSNVDGVSSFLISKFGRSMNKLEGCGEWHNDIFETSQKRTVPTLTVDSLTSCLPPPTVMKIDVEGAEMKVLQGGARDDSIVPASDLTGGTQRIGARDEELLFRLELHFLRRPIGRTRRRPHMGHGCRALRKSVVN